MPLSHSAKTRGRGREMRATRRSSRHDLELALDSIRRIVRALRLASQRTHLASGISAAQLYVLQQLGDGALSLSELAALTLTDRSSVADVVDRLVEKRLVDRTIDRSDRRRAAVAITAAGQRVLRRSPAAPATELLRALRGLNTADLRALGRLLQRLTLHLGVADLAATMLFSDDEREARPRRGARG